MKIGFLIRVGGIFGSVREVIETGNVLTELGHEVSMFTDPNQPTNWLPNKLKWRLNSDIPEQDCLIFADMPDHKYYEIFKKAKAKVKAYCMMGFDANAESISNVHEEIFKNYWTIADSDWQLDYISRFNMDYGPSIGGVNLKQFHPEPVKKFWDVVWTGDPRKRKGSKTIIEAISGLTSASYWKKGILQDKLRSFICGGKVFVDGHTRGGHCNPVLEAMACGMPVVCTETPCNSAFAIHEETCLRVQIGDARAMRNAIDRLLKNPILAKQLSFNAFLKAQQFDYKIIGARFEKEIVNRINKINERLPTHPLNK